MDYQVSGVYPLVSGKRTHYQAVTLTMSANLIHSLYYIFRSMSNVFWKPSTPTPSTSHKLKHGDLTEERKMAQNDGGE